MEILVPLIERNEHTDQIENTVIGAVNITGYNYIKAVNTVLYDEDDIPYKRFTTLYLTTDVIEIDMELPDFILLKQDNREMLRACDTSKLIKVDKYIMSKFNKINGNNGR